MATTATTKKLVARAPIHYGPHEIRPGDIFTVPEAVTTRLIAEKLAEVYADQAITRFAHYDDGPGDAPGRDDDRGTRRVQ
jgi:hypothetical protein